ncbi:hypothetical protein VIBNISOn1_1610023 [Vibrio nigripulchritudo SOn1]|uniref:Transposase n=1 Tax=Vibrio nigripulchritudo SOn1 TaxID=1238450 RepID=A0AAV2VME5_9VIBR|nr:hypothetical protein VIBNISOn1_1610023 [Vibrio nigripulchritudo SOn1]
MDESSFSYVTEVRIERRLKPRATKKDANGCYLWLRHKFFPL